MLPSDNKNCIPAKVTGSNASNFLSCILHKKRKSIIIRRDKRVRETGQGPLHHQDQCKRFHQKANMIIFVFFFFSILISPIIGDNTSHHARHISDHPLHKGWICSSIFSIIGIILNGLVLFIFFQERNSLITSVNVMIM